MNLLEISKKRKATKAYNSKKISKKDLNYIFEVTNTSPTSMGLEAWRVISLRDNDIKEKLKENFVFNGDRFMQSSDAILFITKTKEWFFKKENNDLKNRIKRNLEASSKELNLEEPTNEKINEMLDFISKSDHGNNGKDLTEWSKRQAYIASSFTMLAAIEKGINSTPLEGFNFDTNKKLKELNLIDEDETLSIVILLGYIDGVKNPTYGKVQLRENVESKFKII